MIYINANDQKPIWGWASKLEKKGKVIVGTVSTSEKDQEGNYVKSFWNTMFVGAEVHDGKITITKAKIYKKKGSDGKEYTNMTAYEWEQEAKIPDGFEEMKGFAALPDSDCPF